MNYSTNLFVTDHPNLSLPPPDTKLWRYMSFAKYCCLLATGKLFFPSAASLDDTWEGSHGMWYGASEELISLAIKVNWNGLSYRDFSGRWNRWIRHWTYVSCWHVNSEQSEAMWKIYASAEGSVAIQSTVGRLRSVLPPAVGISKVMYIDFYASPPTPTGLPGYPNPFIFKKSSLSHEQELRALIQRVPLTEDGVVDLWADAPVSGLSGLTVDIDLDTLVESVHVQPGAGAWLFSTAQSVTLQYGVHASVEQAYEEALF